MIDNFNRYRNKSGYIELEKIKGIRSLEKPTYGSREKIWFEANGIEILFKKNMRANEDVKEIINEQISQFLKIECAEYDIATYQGMQGVITRKFLEPGETYLPTICLLCSDPHHKNSNDIATILKALEHNQVDPNQIEINIQKLFENQVQDMFTSQYDRNYQNTGFKAGFTLAPRHDSAGSFLNIYDAYKINYFLDATNKEELIARYKGIWTKQKIMPNPKAESSIQEFVQYLYGPLYAQMPSVMQRGIENASLLVDQMFLLNLKNIFQTMAEYNQTVERRQQSFYQYILDYNLRTYEKEKENQKKKIAG